MEHMVITYVEAGLHGIEVHLISVLSSRVKR